MKAHENDYRLKDPFKFTAEWRENGSGIARTCSFCGSIHPSDLITALSAENADIELADMKYGWPHKWYINSPAIMAPGAKKFYTLHLKDATPEELLRIEKAMGLHFEFEGDGVRWARI